MPRELVSRKARLELREYFVGTTLSVISNEFESADIESIPIDLPNISGQRRRLVEEYYASIDWSQWADVRKFITVYESVLNEVEDHAESGQEWAQKCFRTLKRWIERDGFSYANGKLTRSRSFGGLDRIADSAGVLNLPELQNQIARLSSSIDSDPSLAIGTAKELVETVCKTVLEQRQVAVADDLDLGQLVKEARKALGLIPESIPNAARGADSIRRLLSNLGNVAQGLSELRNMYGTGHGKHGATAGLAPRHARLAVGAAATLATFILETHEERGL